MKLKKRKRKSVIKTIILVIICTLFILNYVGERITPKVEKIIEDNVNKNIYNYVFYVFSEEVLVNEDLLKIINLNKNAEDEVISVDYNFNVVYKYLNEGLNKLYEGINNLNPKLNYYTFNNGVFFVPVGLINKNNILLENLGFKIPCKVNLITNVEINFKTRVSDYGFNNLLVELYLVVDTENDLFSPNTYKSFGKSYEIVIASKVIVGNIPEYYGGIIEKSSSIVSG